MQVRNNRIINLLRGYWRLALILAIAIIYALIFVFLIPPWQHYDEPNQFEFAWLIAQQAHLPQNNDFNQNMRRDTAASMVEHGFYDGMDGQPNLLLQNKEISIGISQINNRPLYYSLLALFLKPFSSIDITSQLLIARIVSIFLYLITIVCAMGIAIEITKPGNPLRWFLPVTIALLPGFVDIMSAVNDDVGATAIFSLFLWIGVRLINRGKNWFGIIALIVLSFVSIWTKNTITIVLILVATPILFAFLRDSKRRMAWIIIGSSVIITLVVLFTWGDVAGWYRNLPVDVSTRLLDDGAPLGRYVIQIKMTPEDSSPRLFQIIPEEQYHQLLNMPITIGAWIWASSPTRARMPILVTDKTNATKEVQVGIEPRFYSFTSILQPNISELLVVLSPYKNGMKSETTIYYDGIVLANGRKILNTLPEFENKSGDSGQWGNDNFQNLIKNSSAEKGWPRIRSWIDNLVSENFPVRPSLVLAFILDPLPALSYYQAAIKMIGQSFWGRFGWGHVTLLGYRPYSALAIFTLIGIVGSGFAFLRKRKVIPWDVVFFFGVATIIIWGSTLLRGSGTIVEGHYTIPVARYGFPAIIPTMLLLDIGWLEVMHWLEKYLRIPGWILKVAFLLIFGALIGLSIFSILRFYVN